MLLANRIEEFKEYSQFTSLKEFNNHMEMFLAENKDKFTPSEFLAFNRLRKFCAKILGVANASKKKILAAIQEKDDELGVSESTFNRMKRKAIELGILSVQTTYRKNESQSTNLWIFNRFVSNSSTIDTPQTGGEQAEEASEQPQIVEQLTPLKTSIISKTSKPNNSHLNVKRSPYIQGVPKSLQHYQAIFGKSIKTLYSRVWLAVKKLGVSVQQDLMQQIGHIAFEQLKKYLKEGKPLTEDQLCKLAYSISYNQLSDRLALGEILDLNRWLADDLLKYVEKQRAYERANQASQKELDELEVY
jgi:hypothetical protein